MDLPGKVAMRSKWEMTSMTQKKKLTSPRKRR